MEQLIPILTEAFGPEDAVVYLALVFWGWTEKRGKDASQEKRIEENRASAKELYETIQTVRDFKALLTKGRD